MQGGGIEVSVVREIRHVIQPDRGYDLWQGYESFFSSGRSYCLFQIYDINTNFMTGHSSALWSYEICDGLIRHYSLGQLYDLVFLHSLNLSLLSRHDLLIHLYVTAHIPSFDREIGQYEGFCFHELTEAFDVRTDRKVLFASDPHLVILDDFSDRVRYVDYCDSFDVPETVRIGYDLTLDCHAASRIGLFYCQDALAYVHSIFLFQEESLCTYWGTIVDVRTSHENSTASAVLSEIMEFVRSESSLLTGSEYQVEITTITQSYSPSNLSIAHETTAWRFLREDQKNYRTLPNVSGINVLKLTSSLEIHFEARWPYEAIATLVETFGETEEGDFVDLGVWTSDSIWIDTSQSPVVTIRYRRDQSEYAVHVSRSVSTRFLGVAPIRHIPHEETGPLTLHFIT